MNVWIVNPFDNLEEEGARPQRYAFLAAELAGRGCRVTRWTSSFSHSRKAPRADLEGTPLPHCWTSPGGVSTRLVDAPPYRSNTGLARIRNHRAFAANLLASAAGAVESGEIPPPDLVVASTPPLSVGAAFPAFKARFGCRAVLDVMDAWPDAFASLLPGPRFLKGPMLRAALAPLFALSRKGFAAADAITATSETYLALARRRGSSAPMRAFPHASASISGGIQQTLGGNAPLRLLYVGNLGRLYGMGCLIKAVMELERQGAGVTLRIAGSGPDEPGLRKLARGSGAISFLGFLGADALAEELAMADAGIIPLGPESNVAIPYKLPDYASAGLAILECLGGECGSLVASAGAGLHYRCGDARDLAGKIQSLASDRGALARMRQASLALARSTFDSSKVFPAFADFLLAAARDTGNRRPSAPGKSET